MAFMGPLFIGNTVEVTLQLDHTASGPALLMVGYGRPGGTPSGDARTASPGGFARVTILLNARGVLEVGADMSLQTDTGVLIVTENGQENARKKLTGDEGWVYAVVAAPEDDQ